MAMAANSKQPPIQIFEKNRLQQEVADSKTVKKLRHHLVVSGNGFRRAAFYCYPVLEMLMLQFLTLGFFKLTLLGIQTFLFYKLLLKIFCAKLALLFLLNQ